MAWLTYSLHPESRSIASSKVIFQDVCVGDKEVLSLGYNNSMQGLLDGHVPWGSNGLEEDMFTYFVPVCPKVGVTYTLSTVHTRESSLHCCSRLQLCLLNQATESSNLFGRL